MATPKRSGAGSLDRRIDFQAPVPVDDGYGGTTDGWATQFTDHARLTPRLGSETVIAARLQGTQPYTLTVRSHANTRAVRPDWRAVDHRAGYTDDGRPRRYFNIKTIANVDERSAYLEMLVVESEAS